MSDAQRLERLRNKKRLLELRAKSGAAGQQSNPEIPDYRDIDEQGVYHQPATPKPEKPNYNLGDYAIGSTEALWSMLTAVPSALLGAPQGMVEQLSQEIEGGKFGDPDTNKRILDSYMGFMQSGIYQPRTGFGQDAVKKIGDLTQHLPPVLGVPGVLPNASQGMSTAFNRSASANQASRATLKLIDGFKGKEAKARKEVIADRIRKGDQDTDTIMYELDKGDLVPNKRVKVAEKLFGEQGKSAAILFDTMSNGTKKYVNEMLNIIDKGRKYGDKYIAKNRPMTVIGKAFAERAKVLMKLKEEAGKRLKPALTRLEKKQFSAMEELDGFIDDLSSQGVNVVKGKDGSFTLDLSNARVKLSDTLPKAELERILNMMNKPMNGKEAHEFKKFVRGYVTYDSGVPEIQKVSKGIENAINRVSSGINGKLRVMDDSYGKANDAYSSIAEPLNGFRKFLKGTDADSDIADIKLSNIAKRLGSNLQSRGDIQSLIDITDNALANNGIRSIKMKDDILDLVLAIDRIENAFDLEVIQAPNSFASGIAKGTRLAAGDKTVAVEAVMDKLASMKKLDFDERMRAFRELTKERK